MFEPERSDSYDPDGALLADGEQIADIYRIYQENLQVSADEYGRTSEQKVYLKTRYEKIQLPFSYEAADSWDGMYLYATTISIVLIILIGFLTAGIFSEEFRLKSDAVYFSSKHGRTKATRAKITCSQMYGMIVLGGYAGSLLSAGISMLIAAKTRSMSVAVCAPFLLFVVSPFIGRALPFRIFFSLTPDQLTNVMNCARIPYIYQVGNKVFSQLPFIFFLYIIIALLSLSFTYRIYHKIVLK